MHYVIILYTSVFVDDDIICLHICSVCICMCVFGRNALNIVKDDLIAKVDELTG